MEEEKKVEAEEPTEVLGNTDVIEPVTKETITEPVVESQVSPEQPVVETPVVEEQVVEQPVQEVSAEQVVETPSEPAPVEQPITEPVVAPTTPEEPKKKSKLPLILLLLLVLAAGGFAVWYFVLGGNGTKKTEEQKEQEEITSGEKQPKEEKEEEKEPEEEQEQETPTSAVEVTKEEAEQLIKKYAVETQSTEDLHCGMYARLFKYGGTSSDEFTDKDRQLMIITNLKNNNMDKNEFTLEEYIAEGKKLFGSTFEAKVVQNSGSICNILCVKYEYDENSKIMKIEQTQGGGSCSPGSYDEKFVSGKNDGKTITLEYKVLFSKDFENVDDYTNANVDEKGKKYVLTFVKDGDNFIFSKGE